MGWFGELYELTGRHIYEAVINKRLAQKVPSDSDPFLHGFWIKWDADKMPISI
jgi:hypothetical protein